MSRLSERIENFNKAYELFAKVNNLYRLNSADDINRLALMQSFEIVFELGWKVLKDYLKEKGIEVYLPKDVIKSAFLYEVITDGQVWIDMLNSRNASSHEYNQDKVNIILEKVSTEYYNELKNFRESEIFNV